MKKNDIWNIDQDCELIYYKNNRMHSIAFNYFYKMSIERILNKTKLGNLTKDGVIDYIELK